MNRRAFLTTTALLATAATVAASASMHEALVIEAMRAGRPTQKEAEDAANAVPDS